MAGRPTPFAELESALDAEVRARFPDARRVEAYGMEGWQIRRPMQVPWTHGTMDPNFVTLALAERKQGVTLHLANPFDYEVLQKRRTELEKAGFKVMVGCIQFNRKAPYPLAAVTALLDTIRAAMDADTGQPPAWPSPSRKTGYAARKPARHKHTPGNGGQGRKPASKPTKAAKGRTTPRGRAAPSATAARRRRPPA